MSEFKAEKVVSSLPDPLEPDTVYYVRSGVGFDLFVSDTTGSVAYKVNSPLPRPLPAGMMSDVIPNWATVDDGVIPFQVGVFERGGVTFNPSANLGGTGEFGSALIIPKAGLYTITLQLGWTNTLANDGDGVLFEIQKDGLGTDAIPTNEARIINTLGNNSGNELTVTSTVIAELQPNDTIYARVTSVDTSEAELDYGHLTLYMIDAD